MTEQHDATGGDNTTYGEAYHYADNFLQKGDKEAAEKRRAFYARIRHERYLNEQAILQGQSTSSLLMPGLEIRVQGDDAPAVFRKGVLITGVTASAARDRSYELTFTAIPYSDATAIAGAYPPPRNGRNTPGAGHQHGEKRYLCPYRQRRALPGQPRF